MTTRPVQYIRFSSSTMSAPGLTQSSVTSVLHPTEGNKQRKHLIDYDIEEQFFWIRFYDRPPTDSQAKLESEGAIMRSPADYVEFLDYAPPGLVNPKPKAARKPDGAIAKAAAKLKTANATTTAKLAKLKK